MEKIVIEHKGKKEFIASNSRGHSIAIDVPRKFGGDDKNMFPPEIFCMSFGACSALYAIGYCASHSIPYEGIKVEVLWEKAENPSRVSKLGINLIFPSEIKEEDRKRILQAAEHCTIHNTLMNLPEISMELKDSRLVNS